ncbi:MAG TPA: M48 family metallopeptidase [Patescibacteria group bacterium]|nr:M48 family metallopeptidase [Patescibacteria group bacterium]
MLNTFGLVILIILLLRYTIDLIAKILQSKRFDPKIPKEFQGVYNKKDYKRSQSYTKEKIQFSIIAASVDLLFLLIFWFLGGFYGLRVLVQAWELPFLITGLSYVGIIYFLFTIIDLPFQAYFTFVIEEKYGFNKTTVKTFFLDLLKSLLISIVLGAIVLSVIFLMFNHFGQIAWIYVWLIVAIFEIFIMFISPNVIAPMFNKFKPLEKGNLRKAIFNYAKKIGYPLKNIFIMDGSRRSSKSNAFFMGLGKNKKIALFDTLVKKHNIQEIVSILGHEIGHYKKKHILMHILISILNLGLMFYLFSLFLESYDFFNAFGLSEPSIYVGIVIFGFLYTPISYIVSVFTNWLFRRFEYQADYFAKKTTGTYKHLVEALKKLAVNNLSNLYPHPFYVFLYYSHPPLLKRIKALKKID